ncbi:MAG: M43 family zinc metalloprotease, partial [Bacteroidota bacterium]|nr:M43 family zinc metalloprotease [Bacteroidota bacterium]
QLDPNGNCTNGIDRIYSHLTSNADDNAKLNQWPREKYLNVWLVKSIGETPGVAGYAYYPSAVNGFLYPFDGIIILHDYIGSIGTATPFNSRALTHEIGHWLNLSHTWGNTNDPEVGCGDDAVSDTPITKGHLSCDLYTPLCTVSPLVNNYPFTNVSLTSGMIDPTAVPTDSGAVFNTFSAVGVSANSTLDSSFSFDDWDLGGAAIDNDTTFASLTGAINTGKYYQVTLTPEYAYSMTLTGLTFNFKRNGTGVRTYSVRSSKDGFASNLVASVSPVNPLLNVRGNVFYSKYDTTVNIVGSKITLPAASFKNLIAPITFRIYAWNAEDSTGTFSIDNVSFSGSAGIIENTQNFMEYSYCSNMYTNGQKDRMRIALESSISGRNNLWSAANLAATGTDGLAAACAPGADFYANRYSICAGGTITFSRNILYTTPGTTTTQVWDFPGGTPATSTVASPTVTYSTPGLYPVTLTSTNTVGSNSTTKTAYIYVSENFAQYSNLYTEDFENTANFFNFWRVNNLDGNANSFGIVSNTGYSGNHSVKMGGFGNYRYDLDELITPSFDLDFLTTPTLTFRCAATSKASTAADINDELRIAYSNNCGQSWTNMGAAITDANLINNGYFGSDYTPSSPSAWKLHTITIPAGAQTGKVRFRFEYKSGSHSNNIYIDDVNINGVVGVNENENEASFSIYPNPANQSCTISYRLTQQSVTKIEVMDVLGKQILSVNNAQQSAGDYTFSISKQQLNLHNGMYFIKLTVDNQTFTKKLIISE